MKKNIVILHGWQSNLKNWQRFKKQLGNRLNVYLPQLPGFGNIKLEKPLSLDDYCLWLDTFLKTNKVEKPILLAHSFGARVAIKYIADSDKIENDRDKIEKLILVSAAGFRRGWSLKKSLGKVIAKTGKAVLKVPPFVFFKKPGTWLLYTLLREKDYYLADENLKKTMSSILQIDLKKKLANIKISTLICWGAKDKITPIEDAYIFEKEIPDSKLIIWKDAGHNLPFKNTKELVELITQFTRK